MTRFKVLKIKIQRDPGAKLLFKWYTSFLLNQTISAIQTVQKSLSMNWVKQIKECDECHYLLTTEIIIA